MSASDSTRAFNYPYTLERNAAAAGIHLPYFPVRGITVWVADSRPLREAVSLAERFIANAQTKVGPCRKLQYELNPLVNSAYDHLMYTNGYVMPDSRHQVVTTSDFETLFKGETCVFCEDSVCNAGEGFGGGFVMYIPTGNAICDARAAVCEDCVRKHKVTWCDLCSKEYCTNRDAARRAIHDRPCVSVYHIFPANKFETVDAGIITRLTSAKKVTAKSLEEKFDEWLERMEDIARKPCSGPRSCSLLSDEVLLPVPEDIEKKEGNRTPVITPDQSDDEEDTPTLSALYSEEKKKPDPYKTPKLGKRRSVFLEELADAPEDIEWAPRRPKRQRTEGSKEEYWYILNILRDPDHPDHALAMEVAKEEYEKRKAAAASKTQ